MNSTQVLSTFSFSRKKHILYGIFIAVVLFGFSISVALIYDSVNISPSQTNQYTQIEGWDYTSPESLALSLKSNVGDLIYLHVRVDVIKDATGGTRLEFFDHNIMGFTLSITIDADELHSITPGSDEWSQGEWMLTYDQKHSLSNELLLGQDATSLGFSSFYDSIQEDFSHLDGFRDVSNQVHETLVGMRGVGVFHWEIMQVFSDGYSIKIESYNNNLLISHLSISHFLFENDGYVIFFDTNNSTPLHLESKFQTNTQYSQAFEKFLETSNEFLSSVINL